MNTFPGAVYRIGRWFFAALIAVAGAQSAAADEIHVRMLEKSGSGPLSFDPGFVKAKVGDTIVFEPTPRGGHSSMSLLVPAGAQPWSGGVDEQTSVTLIREGVYLYACKAHRMMGMVGVIEVGAPVNLAEATAAAKAESAKFVMNKDRFDKEMAQVK